MLEVVYPNFICHNPEICFETVLQLDDYDWMNYTLTSGFSTVNQGDISVIFEYDGCNKSRMEVTQKINKDTFHYVYEYPTDLFETHIVNFLTKHIESWKSTLAFYGEEYVLNFFNDVITKGNLISF